MTPVKLTVLALVALFSASALAAAQVPDGPPRAAVQGPAVYSEDYGKGPWTIVHGGGVVIVWGEANVGFDNPIIAFDGLDGESFEDPALGVERALHSTVWVDGPGARGIWGTGNVGFDNPIIALTPESGAMWWDGGSVGFEDPALGFEDPALGVKGSEQSVAAGGAFVRAVTPDLVVGGPEGVRTGTDGASAAMNVPERRIPTPEKLLELLP